MAHALQLLLRPLVWRAVPVLWPALVTGVAWAQAAVPSTAVDAPAAPAPAAPVAGLQATAGAAERLLPLEVSVNGAKTGSWLLLERLGVLYAPRDAFEEWRLQLRGEAQSVTHKGTEYIPLDAIPGFSAKVNFNAQSIELNFSPQAFAATRLTTELEKRIVVSPVLTSGFLNYDISYTEVASEGAARVKDLGMLAELGTSGSWGVLTSSQAGRNLLNRTGSGQPSGWVRLETTFTRDRPQSNQTIRLGDSSTRAGMWGRAVYFGGFQWGTNYGLSPGFITQASPALAGVSTAPSTVELYVNDVLRQVSNVPSGPFAIENLPALTGGGEARLVVRDILGRETVITQAFFASSQLLADGLNDWSVDAGRLRLNLGLKSFDYGQGFASGTWRRGVGNLLTLESRAEATERAHAAGAGVTAGLPFQMLAKASLAVSRETSLGYGRQWLLGIERQSLRFGAYLQAQGASREFRLLGQDAASPPVKFQVAGNLTYTPAGNLGSFGLGAASLSRFEGERISTVSASYSTRIGERSNLSFTASRATAGGGGSAVGVSLIVALDSRKVITASVSQRSRKLDAYATASESAGFEGGTSWRVLGGRQNSTNRAEGGLYRTGDYGRVSADLGASSQQTALRLGASGGVVTADGHVFATQRVDESFAIAEVPGYGGVGVGLGSNVLARTDASGIALIPRLTPYQVNSIRIDPRELPISAELDSIEKTAVPAWRSGVKVSFPVRSGRGALLRIVFDDGEAAPAGAVLRIDGDKEDFYVARRGEAFVTGLETLNRLTLTWEGRSCRFELKLPPSSPDEYPRLGPLACPGVAR